MAKTTKIEAHEIIWVPSSRTDYDYVFEITVCDGTIYKIVRCKTIQACEVK
jgi:hypothetical protein